MLVDEKLTTPTEISLIIKTTLKLMYQVFREKTDWEVH